MDLLYPHFDFGNQLDSEVDETNEVGAVAWWCKMVVVPPVPAQNSNVAIQIALLENPVWYTAQDGFVSSGVVQQHVWKPCQQAS